MQAGRLKSAAYISDVGNRVQVAEYPIAIYQHEIGVQRVGGIDAGEREAGATRPRLDRAQMRVASFVWGDDESRIGNLFADADPGGKQVLFIRRPGRAGHESGAGRMQRLPETWCRPPP